jgi:hypothetical protein
VSALVQRGVELLAAMSCALSFTEKGRSHRVALVCSYEARGEVSVVHLAGYLGADAVGRFEGAIGWVIARRRGVVLLDATGLLGFSVEGRAAIGGAAARLVDAGMAVHACVAPALAVHDVAWGAMSLHPDLHTALASLECADQPGQGT